MFFLADGGVFLLLSKGWIGDDFADFVFGLEYFELDIASGFCGVASFEEVVCILGEVASVAEVGGDAEEAEGVGVAEDGGYFVGLHVFEGFSELVCLGGYLKAHGAGDGVEPRADEAAEFFFCEFGDGFKGTGGEVV